LSHQRAKYINCHKLLPSNTTKKTNARLGDLNKLSTTHLKSFLLSLDNINPDM